MNPSFCKKSLAVLLALFLGLSPQIVLAEEPSVKKSKSGICHAKGSTYYSKTKNYTPYQSMEACLKSGGVVQSVKHNNHIKPLAGTVTRGLCRFALNFSPRITAPYVGVTRYL